MRTRTSSAKVTVYVTVEVVFLTFLMGPFAFQHLNFCINTPIYTNMYFYFNIIYIYNKLMHYLKTIWMDV